MEPNPVQQVYRYGQSIWLDYLSRALLNSGELRGLIEKCELSGVTSNPTIFCKAITGGDVYDEAVARLLAEDPRAGPQGLYESLAIEDIQAAADLLRPVYERTDGRDGYVSLECDPRLAYDMRGTLSEARRLSGTVGRPNLMIKVPSTDEGLPAITELIAEGLNINVTLMFSEQDYINVADAYLSGLEQRAAAGGELAHVASVASFFVSRIDVAVDKFLPDDSPLRGKIAVANTKVAYGRFRQTFAGERFAPLRGKSARVQRFLCASTGTKNPDYSDVLYVENFIGRDTINTLSPATLAAFREHGRARPTMTEGLEEAKRQLAALSVLGIDLDLVCRQLKVDGVDAFADSFRQLLDALAVKRGAIAAG